MTKQEILQYILNTPHNTNITILEQKIDEYVGKNTSTGGANLTPFLEGTIETFTIPVDVDNLRPGVFYGCKLLKAIEVENGNTAYKAIDGVLFNADGTMLFAYPASKEGAEYAIPSTVTSIADQAFNGSGVAIVLDAEILNAGGAYPLATDAIKTVVIPEDTKFLDLEAFDNLIGIETVYYNAVDCDVEVDGSEAKGEMYYSRSPFTSRGVLKEIIIGNSVTEIPTAMCFNSSIEKMIIPGNVKNVGNNAFQHSYLSNLIIKEGVMVLGANAFSPCMNLTSVIIPKSVTEIGNYCFGGCTYLNSVTILNPDTIIAYNAFLYCSNSLVIRGYTGSTAHTYAKDNGIAFEAIDIPFTITSDNRHMVGFTGTENETLAVPMTFLGDDGNIYIVTAIDTGAFSGCANLISVSIPNSIANIGAGAFSGCANLEVINFNGTITKFDAIIKEADWRDSSSVTVMCTNGEWIETIPFIVTAENRHMVGYTGSEDEELMIPSTFMGDDGVGYKVTGIGSDAFQNCTSLISVTLPETVMSIDDTAFFGSDSTEVILRLSPAILDTGDAYPMSSSRINTVVIPEDATYVDYDLLMNLPSVTGVHCYADCEFEMVGIEDGKSTSYYDFISVPNSQVKRLIIGGNVTSIKDTRFMNSTLEKVVIADGVTSIGGRAFHNCYNLASLSIADSVTDISYEAFAFCSSLTSVVLPNNLTTIADRTFQECYNLSSVTIPNSVTYIGEMAFSVCGNLAAINYLGTISEWNAIQLGYSWNWNSPASKVACSDGDVYLNVQDFWVDSGNRHMIGYTGEENENLVIPEYFEDEYGTAYKVVGISYSAFDGCGNLASVVIPNSVNYVNSYAFANCTNLTSVTLPYGITSIDQWLFSNCTSLTNVTIPNSVTYIDYGAFNECNALTSITIPNNITSIEGDVFQNCTALETINYLGTSSEWNAISFADNWNYNVPATEIICSDGTVRLAKNFKITAENRHMVGYTGEENENLVIPDYFEVDDDYYKVTDIDMNAFWDCTNLVSVFIPESVKSIQMYAFSTCSGLTNVQIPSSIDYIGSQAFSGCTNLINVTFNGTVEQWNSKSIYVSWYYGSSITNITCYDGTIETPSNLIIDGGFTYMLDFTDGNLIIPETLELYGRIYNITGISGGFGELNSVTIPATVVSIGDWAFVDCATLSTINYTGTTSEWSTIQLGNEWNRGVPATEVICSDGVVTL